MPQPPLDIGLAQEALDAFHKYGGKAPAARALGLPDGTFRNRLKHAERLGLHMSEGLRSAASHAKIAAPEMSVSWIRDFDEEGRHIGSHLVRPQALTDDAREDFRDMMRSVIADSMVPVQLPKRPSAPGNRLLVLDPADVHIGKLSVAAETGYAYDETVAAHRLIEGCRSLIERSASLGVNRVLFVIGNDISHIDTPRRTTTSGTPQDATGSIFSIARVAMRAYGEVVQTALSAGLDVDLTFCPSNHDWVSGWFIAQCLAARFQGNAGFRTSDYYLSERHRKYYRFERNLIGVTHGDGAKEKDLESLMRTEARPHIGECPLLYWYIHHLHHKIKRAEGVRSMAREKDHMDMTIIKRGAGAQEGDNVQIEYVRSPSPPDGWHDRNGYLNRQAVEAFIHDPWDGQTDRLTEWF